MTQPADVSSEQPSIERALVFHLLDDKHDPRWSLVELVAALGDPEPAIETALGRLQEHGVALGGATRSCLAVCAATGWTRGDRDMSAGRDTERLRRFEPVSGAVILVALDRAERYGYPNPRSEMGVYWTTLIAHLGFVRDSWTTRKLRPQVRALIDAGLIVRTQKRPAGSLEPL